MHPSLATARFQADLEGITAELCELRGWTVFSREWPLFDIGFRSPGGRELRLALTCNDWNELAPSIALLTWNGGFLGEMPESTTGIFHRGGHPVTGRPFVCMAGSREYHTHPSHLDDDWSTRRSNPGYRLGEIVTQIWHAWRGKNP